MSGKRVKQKKNRPSGGKFKAPPLPPPPSKAHNASNAPPLIPRTAAPVSAPKKTEENLIVPTAATQKTNGMSVPELARVVQLQSDLSKIARLAEADSRGTTADILSSLPRIVVVGGQSVGKSSLLESFLEAEMLPRNQGLCTRAPLVIEMETSKSEEAFFSHLPAGTAGSESNPFRGHDMSSRVQAEIIRQSDVLCKEAGTQVTDVDIVLKYRAPHVPQLSVVDLPGRHVRDRSLGEKIDAVIKKKMSGEKTIILAVDQAGQDLDDSHACELIQHVDPNFSKVLWAITKIDMIEKDIGAQEEVVKAMMGGATINCGYGFVPVRNKMQKELEERVTQKETRRREQALFSSLPAFKSVQEQCGTAYLVRRLGEIFSNAVRSSIGPIRTKAEAKLKEYAQELEEREQAVKPDEVAQVLYGLEHQFRSKFQAQMQKDSGNIISEGNRLRDSIELDILKTRVTEPFETVTITTSVEKILVAATKTQAQQVGNLPDFTKLVTDVIKTEQAKLFIDNDTISTTLAAIKEQIRITLVEVIQFETKVEEQQFQFVKDFFIDTAMEYFTYIIDECEESMLDYVYSIGEEVDIARNNTLLQPKKFAGVLRGYLSETVDGIASNDDFEDSFPELSALPRSSARPPTIRQRPKSIRMDNSISSQRIKSGVELDIESGESRKAARIIWEIAQDYISHCAPIVASTFRGYIVTRIINRSINNGVKRKRKTPAQKYGGMKIDLDLGVGFYLNSKLRLEQQKILARMSEEPEASKARREWLKKQIDLLTQVTASIRKYEAMS